ncbi:Inner membrane ABC transporter permease protein YdcV [Pseudooceanicola marinus]|uniref:Inner membrane ABC transporter permease protein YdcV n=1 Tax=Pseudooceanicola marinus TaxID=396013 RepID=A0A1X6ZKG9_9RHOB|nr:ABC transporter permease [Pseudooceanicola marinus]PJE31651.1 ABC transporter permease [Pseudooceanicola marinus]SLN54285.1 Inner membrane ABC transporter permease protein YdcV [Pseudooceanicola marinus]
MGRNVLNIYCLAVYTFLLAPIFVVVGASFNAGEFLTFPPQGLSLRWYFTFFENEVFLRAIGTSLWIAAVATFFSVIIGTMAAIHYVNFAGRYKEAVRVAALSPLLLPEILTAIALLFFLYDIGIGTTTMFGLLVGHVLMTLPFVFMNVSASLEAYDTDWSMAARSLGARPFTRFRRIMLPLIKPGMIGGALFSFVISFDIFTISLLLKSIGTATLPIQLFDYLKTNYTPEAAAVSTLSIVATITVVVIVEKVIGLKMHKF